MGDKLVLVADDVSFMRKMIRASLREIGITNIVEAEDGEDAVEHYRAKRPDLVILDITMKKKHGLDTLQEIMELDSGAKVLMCTAVDEEETVLEALNLGAVDLIVKPFLKHELLDSVVGALKAS